MSVRCFRAPDSAPSRVRVAASFRRRAAVFQCVCAHRLCGVRRPHFHPPASSCTNRCHCAQCTKSRCVRSAAASVYNKHCDQGSQPDSCLWSGKAWDSVLLILRMQSNARITSSFVPFFVQFQLSPGHFPSAKLHSSNQSYIAAQAIFRKLPFDTHIHKSADIRPGHSNTAEVGGDSGRPRAARHLDPPPPHTHRRVSVCGVTRV